MGRERAGNGRGAAREPERSMWETAKQHPLFAVICLIGVIAQTVLAATKLLDPLLAGMGVFLTLCMVIVVGIVERVYRATTVGGPHSGPQALAKIVRTILWTFTIIICVVSSSMAAIAVYRVAQIALDLKPEPPEYADDNIPLATVTRIEETKLFPELKGLDEKSESSKALAQMRKFPEWLEAGASPGDKQMPDGKVVRPMNERVVYAVSGEQFKPPYRTFMRTVSAGPYEIVQGLAFLVKTESSPLSGVPVVSLRQIPFWTDCTTSERTKCTSRFWAVSPADGERVILVLHIKGPEGADWRFLGGSDFPVVTRK